MKIGGLQRFTLVDYPGHLACTVFTVGCPFKCPWCHNPNLVDPDKLTTDLISESEIFEFLDQSELEGVVITGGEPTIHEDLPSFIRKIKERGFLVKLDTNGTNPDMLRQLVGRIDYVAMDIKAPRDKYMKVVGLENRKDYWKEMIMERIEESIEILKRGDVDYEFRTTVIPSLLSKKDIVRIAKWISPASRYFLQEFRSTKMVDEDFDGGAKADLKGMLKKVEPLFEECQIRRS